MDFLIKNLELDYLDSNLISLMAVGDIKNVFLMSPMRVNPLLFGYTGSAISTLNLSTQIETTSLEKCYTESKLNSTNLNLRYLIKCYDGFTTSGSKSGKVVVLIRPLLVEITEMPNVTVQHCLLASQYSTVRYLGVTTSNTVTSTTDLTTALNDETYHWSVIYTTSSSTRYLYHNKLGRFIRYSGNSFSINTSGTALTIAYSSTNKFSIRGSSSGRYAYMSNSTTLGNTTSARYWKFYSIECSPCRNNTSTGTSITWKYPKPFVISSITPSTTTDLLYGYLGKYLVSLKEQYTTGTTTSSYYLQHSNTSSSTSSTLKYASNASTNVASAWYLINEDKSKRVNI